MSCTLNNLNFINEFKLKLRNKSYTYHVLTYSRGLQSAELDNLHHSFRQSGPYTLFSRSNQSLQLVLACI